jgi:hypothetical protein
MWIVLAVIVALIAAFLMLRLRARFELSDHERQLLFVGLGRSGPEFDFVGKKGTVRIFGLRIRSFDIGQEKPRKKKEKPEAEAAPSESSEKKKEQAEPKRSEKNRKRSWREALKLVPSISKALWNFIVGLIKSAVVEEAHGEIRGGFSEPHLTGQAFGYFQAVLGAVPVLAGRIAYIPDWSGEPLVGSMRVTVAIPMYKFVWRTLVLVLRLPVRKIIKVAIGEKEGEQDVQ